jgi:hypothetical protein
MSLTFRMLVTIMGRVVARSAILAVAMIPHQMNSQPGAADRPSFDVASVKPAAGNVIRGERLQFLPGGRFIAENTPVCMLITTAYNLPPQSPRVSGGPDWIRSERFDIEARSRAGRHPSRIIPQGA